MLALKFTSYVSKVQKEMEAAEKKQRAKAAKYLTDRLKDEASLKFGAGSSMVKGVGHRNDKDESRVGMGPPAYSAHLIEFGTDSRFTKSGKATGHIQAKPFIFPLFDREAGAVTQILQEEWF